MLLEGIANSIADAVFGVKALPWLIDLRQR
jgi:hypothetical protein